MKTALIVLVLPLLALAEVEAPDEQPLFRNQATLEVRIEAPVTTLMRKRSDTEYLDGSFTFTEAGVERQLDLKLRARGKYRRQKDVCNFPPVRLNFKKGQLGDTQFAGQDKLKLVTPCRNNSSTYEQYVLKEYMAYRLFNELTDYSFGARLMRVTWIDTDRDGQSQTRYGFVIEDDDLLAERMGTDVVDVRRIEYKELDAARANLVSVFEYFIGNTDYSLVLGARDDRCCHNVVLIGSRSGAYTPVPYDFDFAGIVHTRYAKPNPSLPISSVLRRHYRGPCEHNDHVPATVARFRESEAALKAIVANQEGLDARSRDKAVKYVEGFYRDIADDRAVERNLLRKCGS